MQKIDKPISWVVYRMMTRVKRKTTAVGAVCEQEEWEAMERAQPGQQPLIRSGISTEGEAERLARSIEPVSVKSDEVRTPQS